MISARTTHEPQPEPNQGTAKILVFRLPACDDTIGHHVLWVAKTAMWP
jgi:hypothetical protein